MCVKSEDNKLGWNFENAERLLSKGVKVTKVLDCGDDVNKSEIKKIWLNEMAKAWKDKVLSGQFVHGILENSDQSAIWKWLGKDLEVKTETLLCDKQK